jgi:hypothetical protein
MKFETLMLKALFSACLLVCFLFMGAMLTTRASVPDVAAGNAPATSLPN